ncbi:hypothetical protein AB0C65_15545 [Nocardia sp. NPDC048505]|uniref:hypothetical protein n=1 Tax=Nocardia sp. NPDC048505 TaxID=3155756 RepID=UPI0033EB4D53
MKRSFATAVLAGALALAPNATANADNVTPSETAAPVGSGSSSASGEYQACMESLEGLRHGCPSPLQFLLGSGSAKS